MINISMNFLRQFKSCSIANIFPSMYSFNVISFFKSKIFNLLSPMFYFKLLLKLMLETWKSFMKCSMRDFFTIGKLSQYFENFFLNTYKFGWKCFVFMITNFDYNLQNFYVSWEKFHVKRLYHTHRKFDQI